MSAILATLQLLVPTGPIEIRALAARMMVQRFDAHEAAAAWAERAEEYKPKGVYVVMNAFDPAAVTGGGVTDAAVTQRRWLLVDVDPERPKDSNATKAELELAASSARAIEEYLLSLAWPAPVRALSGNGAHLLYRIDLPNDSASKALVDGVLRHLAAEFNVAGRVNVDTTVSNAARITKLYGTISRKGPHSDERPHRMSKITRVPEPLQCVSAEQLADVAAKAPGQPAPAPRDSKVYAPGESAYDLADVLARVHVRSTEDRGGAIWYHITCPWAFEHSSDGGPKETALVVQGGAYAFTCFHAHCADRDWKSLRGYLAIDTKAWKERDSRPRTGGKAQSMVVAATETAPVPSTSERVTVGDSSHRLQLIQRMDAYAAAGSMPGAVPSGFKRLDGMLLGGFRPGKFYVLGGESGRGKTTLLLQWALTAAGKVDPKVVAIVTPEMDRDSLDERVMSAQSGFGVADYRESPTRGRDAWGQAYVPQNIRASFDADDIAAFVEEERPALLIVDYAQQAVSYEIERRHTALAMLGAQCLEIAKKYQIPVLLGTQVNVSADREFTVRETRILEHQADAMVFIDIVYEKTQDGEGKRQVKSASLLVAKNRHGYAGRIPVTWEASLFRFAESRY